MAANNNNNDEVLTITAEKLTREDTIVVTESSAGIEKGLVIHGANPGVQVGDALVAVNGEEFGSMEDLTQVSLSLIYNFYKYFTFQLLTKAQAAGTTFQLQIVRPKQQDSTLGEIERVIVEIQKEEADQLEYSLTTENDFVVVEKIDGIAAAAGKLEASIFY